MSFIAVFPLRKRISWERSPRLFCFGLLEKVFPEIYRAGVHKKDTRFSLTESRRFSSDFRLLDEPVCCSENQLFY